MAKLYGVNSSQILGIEKEVTVSDLGGGKVGLDVAATIMGSQGPPLNVAVVNSGAPIVVSLSNSSQVVVSNNYYESSIVFQIATGTNILDGQMLSLMGVLTGAMRQAGGSANLPGIMLFDREKKQANLDVLFFKNSSGIVSNLFGSLDSSNYPSANRGRIEVRQADWSDCSTHSSLQLTNLNLPLMAEAGLQDVYVLLQARGAHAFTNSSSITGLFSLERN